MSYKDLNEISEKVASSICELIKEVENHVLIDCVDTVQEHISLIPSGLSSGSTSYMFKNIFIDVVNYIRYNEDYSSVDISEGISVSISEMLDYATIKDLNNSIDISREYIESIPDGKTTGEPMSMVRSMFMSLFEDIIDMNKPKTKDD